MTRQEFSDKVSALVSTYIADEEMYDDNAQLVVDPSSLEIELHDGDEDIDDTLDQYDVMDLLLMGTDGHWEIDPAAISDLADEYIK